MDGFYGRSHGLGIRLRPVKTAGESLKKIFNLLACDRLILLVLGWTGRIRIVFGHGNLIVIRCHCRRIRALADAESYTRFGVGGNTVAECGTISPRPNGTQNSLVFRGAAAIQDKGAMHVTVRSNNEADADVQIIGLNLR